MLAPLSVCVPLPVFASATVPLPLAIAPLKLAVPATVASVVLSAMLIASLRAGTLAHRAFTLGPVSLSASRAGRRYRVEGLAALAHDVRGGRQIKG